MHTTPITDHAAILEALKGDDWREVLCYARWSIDDITEIVAMSEGQGDMLDWLLVAKLKDGRYSLVEARTCETGWDACSDGNCYFADNLQDLVLCELDQESLIRLRLPFKPF